jgi:hypothetical protein
LRWKAITCSVTDTSPKESFTPLRDLLDEDLGLLLRLRVPVAVEPVDGGPPGFDVQLVDLIRPSEVQVNPAGMNRRERALGLDRTEELAGVAFHDRHRVRGGGPKRDVARGEVRPTWQVALALTATQLTHANQGLGPLAPSRAQELGIRFRQGQLVGGREHVRRLDPVVLVVEDGALHRSLQELVGMAAEELVERVLARDVQREPLAAPPGPAPHLPQAGDRAGKSGADRRVEIADVDPQLERVGRDDREQVSRGEPGLDLAALLRRVARPVRRDPLGELRPAELLEPHPGEALDQLDPPPAAQEADRSHPLADQIGQQLRGLGQHRAPGHRPGVDDRRVPHPDAARRSRGAIGVDEAEWLADQALG